MSWNERAKNLFGRPRRAQGKDERIERLVSALANVDPSARREAAQALGELGAMAEDAIAALEQAIADEDGEVCLAASDALSKIRIAAH